MQWTATSAPGSVPGSLRTPSASDADTTVRTDGTSADDASSTGIIQAANNNNMRVIMSQTLLELKDSSNP